MSNYLFLHSNLNEAKGAIAAKNKSWRQKLMTTKARTDHDVSDDAAGEQRAAAAAASAARRREEAERIRRENEEQRKQDGECA